VGQLADVHTPLALLGTTQSSVHTACTCLLVKHNTALLVQWLSPHGSSVHTACTSGGSASLVKHYTAVLVLWLSFNMRWQCLPCQ
jgi:hypothetical protein